jgi:hypothetical protein
MSFLFKKYFRLLSVGFLAAIQLQLSVQSHSGLRLRQTSGHVVEER